ncbi:MAG TPA: EAL domain-containing protein [Caulobacteraceae bacterium]|nr:EAL domain-containing protein [Caulobacteraceae bacterium]
MRNVTNALLGGAYLCLALTVALLVWRGGGGAGAGIATLFGGLGFAVALHAMLGRGLGERALRRDIDALRDANRILADQMEGLYDRMAGFAESVQEDAERRSEELTSEVHVLEDLVRRMRDGLEDRMARAQAHEPPPAYARHHSQQIALLETVREALSDNRVDLYLQPVVSLPQRRTVFYESFSRLRDASGRVMMPAEYLSVAEPEGLVSVIDNLLLFRCVQIVRRLAKSDRKVGIFCNVALGSLADETFFPQFLEFLAENRDMAGSLIFELGQPAFDRRGATEARNMAKLADLGFRFSLDKVSDLDLNFPDLARADVKFVKVTADVLLNQLIELDGRLTLKSLKDLNAADLADLTRRYGVELIAEKVETERQVVDVLELNIAYGQGNLFGEPRAIKDSVLAEADPPADFIRSTLRRRAAAR